MKTLKTLISALVLSLFAAAALAAGTVTGTVTAITPLSSGLVEYTFSGTITGTPGCNTNAAFVLDATTAGGAVQAAHLAQAKALGNSVAITGTGDCVVRSGWETINYFTF